MNVPAVFSDVTVDWLNDALTGSGFLQGNEVTDFTIAPLGEGLGYIGLLYKLIPTYRNPSDLPASMILKFPSTETGARMTGNGLRAFEREGLFYKSSYPGCPCAPPTCYYSHVDVDNDEFLLIIENIEDARFINQVDGTSAEDAISCMQSLAELHARYWNAPKHPEAAWAPLFSEYGTLYRPLIESGTPQMLQNWEHMMPALLRDSLERANALYPEITKQLGALPSTLIHGDPRIENVAFVGQTPRFYDWQLASQGPGAYDLMYFMKQSMDSEVRRGCQDEMFGIYLKTLAASGVTDYSRTQLEADIGLASCTIWGFLGMVGNFFFPNEQNEALAQITFPRFASVIEDFGGVERLMTL